MAKHLTPNTVAEAPGAEPGLVGNHGAACVPGLEGGGRDMACNAGPEDGDPSPIFEWTVSGRA